MPGGPNRPPMVAAPTESGQSTAAHAYVAGRKTGCSRSRARVRRDAAGPGEDESEGHRGQGEQHRDETGRETRVEAEPDHRQNDHADRQPQRELQRSSHADRAYYGVPRTTPPGSSASRGGRENRADRGRRVRTVLCAMLFCSTSVRQRIRHGIRHTAAGAGRRPCPSIANGPDRVKSRRQECLGSISQRRVTHGVR